MTDKVQKIIAEIKDRISNYQEYIDSGYDDEEVIKQEELKDLLNFIDSIQEEPKECMYSKDNYTDEDRKVLCDGCKEERCKYSKLNTMLDVALSKETKESWNKRLEEETKESVSEDLDFIATRNALAYVNNINRGESPWLDSDMELAYEDGMKAGANWQKQQMLKGAVDTTMVYNVCSQLELNLTFSEYVYKSGDKVKVIIIKED